MRTWTLRVDSVLHSRYKAMVAFLPGKPPLQDATEFIIDYFVKDPTPLVEYFASLESGPTTSIAPESKLSSPESKNPE